jgi:2-polyprenyl-3-methyl-5-hydroxy-6-metoxy-1,4-benzoquinol methylase
MLEKINNCPICKNNLFEHHIECKDYMISEETFNITKCTNCSFLFTNPRPTPKDLGAYYESEEYISHSNKSSNLTNTLYKIARRFTLTNKLKIINKLTDTKTILDYGCGTGYFLSTCKQNGWAINGFEPNIAAREQANVNANTTILSEIEDLKKIKKVSLITLWHVLEHIPDLNKIFSILKSTLSANGKIIIAVPNHESYDANHYKEHWAAYDVPRHLYHFSKHTMK